jgi:hypothetical protein
MAFWLSVAVALAIGSPGAASAQQSFSGRAADPLDGSCVNVRDVSINWRDGTVSPATFRTTDDFTDIGGTPIPIKWLNLTGTHTYAVAGTYDLLVNYRTTCLNGSGDPYEFNAVNKPGFRVSATGPGPVPPIPKPPAGCASAAVAIFSTVPPRASGRTCRYPPLAVPPEKAASLEVKRDAQAKHDKLFSQTNYFCGRRDDGNPHPKRRVSGFELGAFGCYATSIQMWYLRRLINDPPDSRNASKVALPKRVTVGSASACKGSRCAAVRRPTRQYVAADARAASILRAMSAAVDRFSGAALLLPQRGAVAVGDMQVLQAAVLKALSGELADALGAKRAAGKRLARALRRAHVAGRKITDAEAHASAERLARLKGIPRSVLAALARDGVSRDQVRALFAAAVPAAHGTSLYAILTRKESTATLRRHHRSLTVAEVAHIENALFKARRTSGKRHVALKADLIRAGRTNAGGQRRSVMRRFAKDARPVAGAAGTLLRQAGAGVR